MRSYEPCLKGVKSRLTECELELYVPDGFEITNAEMSGNGSLTKIDDTDNCYKATNLKPQTSYKAQFNFTYPSGRSKTIVTFDTQTVDDALEVSATSDITSITITLTKGSDEVSEQGIVFDSNFYPLLVGESKTFTGLAPNRTYDFYKYVRLNGEAYSFQVMSVKTLNINIDDVVKTYVSANQASFTVRLIERPADGWECGVGFNGERYPLRPNESKTITGLIPYTSYYYTLWVKINDTYCDFNKQIHTDKVTPTFMASAVSPISVNLTGKWGYGDAVVTGCQAIVDGRVTEMMHSILYARAEVPINYNNDLKHTIAFKVIGEGWEFTSESQVVSTPYLKWHDGQAVATSTHSARLMYEVNLPTGTPGTGIEWRRIDAPNLVPSTKVPCEVVDGKLVGTLKNLKDDVYYKFRPYYTALDGKSYYGTWVGLFTGDADVFFEPEVLTYAPTSSEQSVTLSGYALEGSDEITSQGFEYRPSTPVVRATSGWSVVKADGILMKATLTDLIPNATYVCRSFVTTSTGTYYGEEQQFTAPALTGIETIEEDTNEELNVALRENPVNGDAYIRISGSYNKATCSVYSLSGTLVIQKEVAADGLWQPVEMDHCVKGMYVMHVVCGNERKSLRVIKR